MKNLCSSVIVVWLLAALAIGAEQCADCKCTEYPVPGSCSKCCGVAIGTITKATASSVTIKTENGAERTFTIQHETKTDHNLAMYQNEKGSKVRVVYNTETKVAGSIQSDK